MKLGRKKTTRSGTRDFQVMIIDVYLMSIDVGGHKGALSSFFKNPLGMMMGHGGHWANALLMAKFCEKKKLKTNFFEK